MGLLTQLATARRHPHARQPARHSQMLPERVMASIFADDYLYFWHAPRFHEPLGIEIYDRDDLYWRRITSAMPRLSLLWRRIKATIMIYALRLFERCDIDAVGMAAVALSAAASQFNISYGISQKVPDNIMIMRADEAYWQKMADIYIY